MSQSLTGEEVARIAIALEDLGPTLTWPDYDKTSSEKLPGQRALTESDRAIVLPGRPKAPADVEDEKEERVPEGR